MLKINSAGNIVVSVLQQEKQEQQEQNTKNLMDFSEALKAFKQGKKIRRACNPNNEFFYKIKLEDGDNERLREDMLCTDDITADDWYIVD